MKKTFSFLLVVALVLGLVYILSPNRIRGQMTTTASFLGNSFGNIFSVVSDSAGDTRDFVLEKSDKVSEKAEEIVNPKTPSEKREVLLEDLGEKLSQIQTTVSVEKKNELVTSAQEIVEEVRNNNEDSQGFIGSIVSSVTGSGDQMCKTE